MPDSGQPKLVRAATLADVGRAAGVSAMAASTVLNGARTSSRISDQTRARIVAAAARLRYRPNATARALVNRRMNTLGVVAALGEGDLNTYVMEVFTGILGAATSRAQTTTMFTLHDWSRDAGRLHGWCDGRVDGVILLAPLLTREAAGSLPRHTPFVALHANAAMPEVVNIESDEERGAWEMTRHLLQQGHRRLLHVTGDLDFMGAQRRIAGFKRALIETGLPASEDTLVPARFSADAGRSAMRQWLRAHAGKPLPQAIFCANDGIAFGCIEALAEAGLRVPQDVSVAGFDDTLSARTTVPQLTTVRQPLREMGCCAVELLLSMIDQLLSGGTAPVTANPVVFPVELVLRASVAAPALSDRFVPGGQSKV